MNGDEMSYLQKLLDRTLGIRTPQQIKDQGIMLDFTPRMLLNGVTHLDVEFTPQPA